MQGICLQGSCLQGSLLPAMEGGRCGWGWVRPVFLSPAGSLLGNPLFPGRNTAVMAGRSFCCCCRAPALKVRWRYSMGCARRWPRRRRGMGRQALRRGSASVCVAGCQGRATQPPACWPGRMRRCMRPRAWGAIPCGWRRRCRVREMLRSVRSDRVQPPGTTVWRGSWHVRIRGILAAKFKEA